MTEDYEVRQGLLASIRQLKSTTDDIREILSNPSNEEDVGRVLKAEYETMENFMRVFPTFSGELQYGIFRILRAENREFVLDTLLTSGDICSGATLWRRWKEEQDGKRIGQGNGRDGTLSDHKDWMLTWNGRFYERMNDFFTEEIEVGLSPTARDAP